MAALSLAGILIRHGPATDVTEPADPAKAEGASPAPAALAPRGVPTCSELIAGMSMRDRLAQRLMVGIDPHDPAAARAVATRTRVGGFFVGGNATRILRAGALTAIQSTVPHSLAMAVDDEGGRVQRIDALAGQMPSARLMGAMAPADVRRIAAERGRRLADLGITVDFAPVVDLGGQQDDAVIGDRSFSPNPTSGVVHAGAFAAGLSDAGVVPVFKHFPGHGRGTGDSHAGVVTTPALESLRGRDLLPYEQLLAHGKSAVMVGHLDVPGLTAGVPATPSPPSL